MRGLGKPAVCTRRLVNRSIESRHPPPGAGSASRRSPFDHQEISMSIRSGWARLLPLMCAVAALAAWSTSAGAGQPAGSLDPGFGSGGIVVTRGRLAIEPTGGLLQPDGKIIVVGELRNTPEATMSFALVRYHRNGRIDGRFGNGGQAHAQVTNFINNANGAALQADGKILIAGEAQSADGTLSEFAVVRFNADGTLDQGFGTAGQVTTNFVGVQPGGVSNPATSVLLQADGKILVGGSASVCPRHCGPRQTALARYTADGKLDAGFGSGGRVSAVAIGSAESLGEDAAGNIFALNGAQIAAFSPAGVLLPAGAIPSDTITVRTPANFKSVPAIFQPDGRYLVAGAVPGSSWQDTDVQLTRHELSGALDGGFVSPPFGFAEEDAIAQDSAQAIALYPNGRIAVGGIHRSTDFTAVPLFGVARLDAGGALDASFGSGGTVTTRIPGFANGAFVNAVLIQPNDKLVAIGIGLTRDTARPSGLVLARYLGR
jgi:uncharacterized delta-60 repeat protein